MFVLLFSFLTSWAHADAPNPVPGWNVDCGNHCNFSEFSHNCQGVYYLYSDGTKSYSSWSSNYAACQETGLLQANTHIISPNLVQCGCPAPVTTPPANTSAALSSTTRNQLELLRAQVQGWAVCAPDPAGNFSDIFVSPLSYKSLNTCQYFRKHRMKNVNISVGGCYPGLQGFLDTGWHQCTFSGDQLSNTAENCVYGDKDRCTDMKDAQDPVTGMWYRNGFTRRHPETSLGQPLFSRDALDGLVAYIAATHDKESLRKWLVFVRNNVKSPPIGLFNICPPRPNIPKPPTVSQQDWDGMLFDDRCGLEPVAAGQVYQVALAAGLTNADMSAIGTDLYSVLTSGWATYYPTTLGEAETAPALGGPSYQIGDVADSISISMVAGSANNPTLLSASQAINNRTDMLNPFYHFLANNRVPTEYGAYLINKYCKAPRPDWGVWFDSGWAGQGGNSTGAWYDAEPFIAGNYQYAGGWGPYGQKMLPIGHECIAFLNMYLGNGNYTELQCNPGDTLVNGACEKFAFTASPLAAVPGLDFQIRTGDAKLNYMAVDMSKCPYGGSFEPADQWGTPPRCSFASGLSPSQFASGVNYWVDPTEAWPGIYYAGTSGTCPHGGAGGNPNCQLKGYPGPVISQSVAYWVDTSPSWPGVYYQKINGACSHGGISSGPNCLVKAFGSGFLDTSVHYFVRSNPAHPGVYYYPQVIPEKILPIPVPVPYLNSASISSKETN